MQAYINKLCKESTRAAVAAVNHPVEKKHCNAFANGEDGYCVNYIKPKAIEHVMIELTGEELSTVKVYEAAVENCIGQCKVRQSMPIEKK